MRHAFVFLAALAVSITALGQTVTCNATTPTSMKPGDTATLSLTWTNTGSTPITSTGSAMDGLLTGFDMSGSDASTASAIFPHLHAANVRTTDPQMNQCFISNDATRNTVFALCYNDQFHNVTVAPGASMTVTTTFSVDAGAPASTVEIFSSIIQGGHALCDQFSNVAVGTSCSLVASGPSIAQSNQTYTISWNRALPPPPFYSIDESTTADFSSNVRTQTPGNPQQDFQHSVGSPTAFYYRVRSGDCGSGSPGPYSPTIKVVVQGTPQPSTGPTDVVVPIGSTGPVGIPISVSAPPGTPFNATMDKSFFTVTPATGTFPASGTIVFTVTASDLSNLSPGANTGTLIVTSTTPAASAGIASGTTTVATVPVTISIVTPVEPGAIDGAPPPNALVLPVITHVNGASAIFLTDVRLANTTGTDVNYLLLLTPTLSNGTITGAQTVVTVASGRTIAMNDIAKDFFGFGATGAPNDQGFGSLLIIPQQTASLLTFAASRTYATTSAGTFGQFIPANRLAAFAKAGQVLSLQHVAHSPSFRTNLGLVEGSGVAATGTVRIVDDVGVVRATVPYSLQPGEHEQLNGFIANNGVNPLDDGRLEVTVDPTSGGAVTAYASVLDNTTNDPYAVAPVRVADISATRYVTPGVADLNNGAANFHSDLRIYNGGTTTQNVALTYYPQGAPGSPVPVPSIPIGPGQVKAYNNVLPTVFGVSNSGGSVLITTPGPSSLVATARTYSNAAAGGTFGQFIPGVSPAQGIGVGDRALEILQLEQSSQFRSNIGVAELTSNQAHVRLSLVLPDSKITPSIEFDLAPNEFRQISMSALNPPDANTYNARMMVEVTSGSGRVTAYGSVIDNRTQDPTYVPAQ